MENLKCLRIITHLPPKVVIKNTFVKRHETGKTNMLHREILECRTESVTMVIGTHVFRWKAVETDSSKRMLTTLHSACTSERGTKPRAAVSISLSV